MLNTEITVGVPDYYRDDQFSQDIDNYIERLVAESSQLGITVPHYLLEFCE